MKLIAIDIGTTKICVLIAQQTINNDFEIIGIGKSPSKGLARGVVVDILSAAHSIKTAVKEAELMAGCKIESAIIGISGSHINSFNSQGMISLKHKDIREHDINQVLAVAQSVPLPEGQQILHAIPQFYTIDTHQKVQDPLGMFGMRLEAQVHIITGAIGSVQNLIRCCELAGVKVQDIVLEPLASAQAVLSVDERQMGVALLDIGGGTSDFAIYQHSAIRHTKVFPYAGTLFTNDIAVVLRTTSADAERIKKEYGCVYHSYVVPGQEISVECAQGDQKMIIYEQEVYEILECRITELLTMVHHEMEHYYFAVPGGLVITGGGSLLHGLQEHAQEILKLPVRIGKPKVAHYKEFLENPMHATGYGLLVHGMKKLNGNDRASFNGSLSQKVLARMKSWIFDFF
ncbi:MAG: cell division protein FtsA [Candidatus Babeliaceae bacterium]|nr:cell division protein FtsA [Candidatus Babeliaceae bacterium]